MTDFERSQALTAIARLLEAKNIPIATAAITVFGRDSPYFEDEAAPHWLVGIGKGAIRGFAVHRTPAGPLPDVVSKELLHVATNSVTPKLRALAIRALAPSRSIPAEMVGIWLRDPSIAVRQAAVLASVELPDHQQIKTASTDRSPELRHAAALAVGFARDPYLLLLLDKLLQDPEPNARTAAALSLLSFPLDQAAPVMKTHLASDFQSLFVNALAHGDPQPYLAMLGEIIEHQLQPANWWGGLIPAADSWRILFDFVKSRPAAELSAGNLDRSLDALEGMQWFGSSEPRDLYAMYLRRGLVSRAKQFRETTRKTLTYDIDYFFDMADRNPAAYVQ